MMIRLIRAHQQPNSAYPLNYHRPTRSVLRFHLRQLSSTNADSTNEDTEKAKAGRAQPSSTGDERARQQSSTSLTATTRTNGHHSHPSHILAIHPFHSHRCYLKLESTGFTPQVSETILEMIKTNLKKSEKNWLTNGPKGGILLRSVAEGQAYLYQAALNELKTSMNLKVRNDSILTKTEIKSIEMEIESLDQKIKESLSILKNDILLEFNNRKEEFNADQKKIELFIQELNSKLTILAGDVRTEIETRKWVTTRRCVVAISSLALYVIILTSIDPKPKPKSGSKSEVTKDQGLLKSVEDLGILPSRDQVID